MPPEGVTLLDHIEILSYEEMLRIITVLSRHGIKKIRLTGGEPLVRKGIVEFISKITALQTITDISMTTNGSLLAGKAQQLKTAGLHRVNISLDTINPQRFHSITGKGKIGDTLAGITAALKVGLTPVKINVVLTEVVTESDLAYFIDLVCQYPIAVRFIEYMPIGNCGVKPGLTINAVKSMLSVAGGSTLEAVSAIDKGNGPAKYYQLPQAKGTFGFITPISEHFCNDCNRLRLTADGKFKPCLLSDKEIDVKGPMRSGANDEELASLFYEAIREKPSSHDLCRISGHSEFRRRMSQIGG
jgi:cyclic pyranopterin phosphate synthase